MDNDIFISYKNDDIGNQFAKRLKDDLDHTGYSVYLNSDEHRTGSFPDEIRAAIDSCRDFILVLSKGCIEQLIENHPIDWVREEILYANKTGKNIIPILIGKAIMPSNKMIMPNELQFLPDQKALVFPEQYMETPYSRLLELFKSNPGKGDFRRVANGNPHYNISEDINNTLEKAKQGDCEAMYEIGCMHFYGFATENCSEYCKDYSQAYRWLNQVSMMDSPLSRKADMLIAKMYYTGAVPREKLSLKRAFEYRAKGEDLKSSSTLIESLLFMKKEGIGAEFNYEEISEMIENMLENMTSAAKSMAADFYINYGKYDKAIDILEQIDEIIPDAEYKLGNLYLKGLHCTPPRPDPYRAEHHFINAADAGMADALHTLGLINFRGSYGYRQNLVKARSLFEQAALKGHRAALYDYAWMCEHGLGGNRDIPEAINYFEKGAQQGLYLCMVGLSLVYQEKECRNYQKAFDWATKAVATGDAYSEFTLGNLYFFGRGCEYNIDKAAMHYKNALNLGVNEAEFMLKRIEKMESTLGK